MFQLLPAHTSRARGFRANRQDTDATISSAGRIKTRCLGLDLKTTLAYEALFVEHAAHGLD